MFIVKNFAKKIFLYIILGIISGLSGFFFIIIVNNVIDLLIKEALPKENNFTLFFITVIFLFFISRLLLSEGIIKLSQKIFWSTRKDIIYSLIRAPYNNVYNLKDEVYSVLTTDINNITNASLVIISFMTSIILVISGLIYLAYLSILLFVICISGIILGILIYFKSSKINHVHFKNVRDLEENFVNIFNSVIEGNKEIKINSNKGNELYDLRLLPTIEAGERRNIKAYTGYLNSQLISQLFFYAVIAIILVKVGDFYTVELGTTISFVFALLYLLGPIVNIMVNIPVLNSALISYNKLKFTKKKLLKNQLPVNDFTVLKNKEKFNAVSFKDYGFAYEDKSFSVGPLNLTVRANEIVFIYGGNGSGKTTFINILLHLFTPCSGAIEVNSKRLSEENFSAISSLFTPIFSDFYLFDEFYGINNVDEEKVNHYLQVFKLEEKVQLKNGKFNTTELSTGQRKRLALIMAIMEDRPILVLDEWAADQDPEFRKKFYTEIIHKIVKEENKTIVAITHDDKYYSEADRLFKMNYGKLEEVDIQKDSINPKTLDNESYKIC